MGRRRPRVLITRRLHARARDRVVAACDVTLRDAGTAVPRDRLLAQVAGKAGTITLPTDRVDEEFLAAAGPQLSVVANYSVGYDNIDVDACTSRGVLATNTPDVMADTSAHMAFALMIGAARQGAEDAALRHSRGERAAGFPVMPDPDVRHMTLGIVGFGRIGQALARRARSFGMNVVYHGPRRVAAGAERRLGARYLGLEGLLREADFVSLHTNLSSGPGHLISAERLAVMKPGAVLLNTSRGPVVDEQALASALRGGRILAAGIEVCGQEAKVHPDLLACQNSLVVRNLGSATVGTRLAMANLAVDNLLASLHGERPPALLNPQAWLQRSARARRQRLVPGSAPDDYVARHRAELGC
jgi:glyoxylate reductase